MTTSESKGRFFCKTNRFESIRITNRIDSNRELECSSKHAALADLGFLEGDDSGNPSERASVTGSGPNVTSWCSCVARIWLEDGHKRRMLYRARIVLESCSYRNCNRPLSDSLEFIGAI